MKFNNDQQVKWFFGGTDITTTGKVGTTMDRFTLRITRPDGRYIEVVAPDLKEGDCDFQLESDIACKNGHPQHHSMLALLKLAHYILDSAIEKTLEKAGIREDLPFTTKDGTPTARRFEPFDAKSIALFEEQASEGSATALLMLDVAKLPEDQQDDAQDKLLADGMLKMEYDESGEEIGTHATKKAVDVLVCEGRLEYLDDPVKGYLCTRRPGGKFHRRVVGV
jgi:hypothetical protein